MVEQSQAHGASSGKDAVSHQKLITSPGEAPSTYSEYLAEVISVAWSAVLPRADGLLETAEGPSEPAPLGFVLVSEQGYKSLTEANFVVEHFATEVDARLSAVKLWCCWCLFRTNSTGSSEEIASGGVGFAWKSIRRYAHDMVGYGIELKAAGEAEKNSSIQVRIVPAGPGESREVSLTILISTSAKPLLSEAEDLEEVSIKVTHDAIRKAIELESADVHRC